MLDAVRRLFWRIRLAANCNRARRKLTHEICKRCGKEHKEVWRATDDSWNRIVAGRYRILCMRCFVELARKAGCEVRWRAEVTEVKC